MAKRILFVVSTLMVSVVLIALIAFGQGRGERGTPPPARPDNPQSLAQIDAARKIAGDDAFLRKPFDFFCVTANTRANDSNAPELEPVQLFDDVYAVGNSETTVYAITTSDGIVLIDAGYPERVESVLIPGLRKLGLDPARVKYILVGHGHGDHFGGARYFQDHYATRIATTAADWDLINPPNQPANQARPKKDVVLSEGQPLRFGGLTFTPILIPGHTPGSLAFIFPVRDKGKVRIAGLFGGTALTLNRLTTDALKQYIGSIGHYLEAAKKMNVEVELQNHPIFDGMPERLAQLKKLKPGAANPFVVGTDRYIKMWNIVSQCIQAEIARRE